MAKVEIEVNETQSIVSENLAACSAEISKNAKGDYSYSIKSYAKTVDDAIEASISGAKKLNTRIDSIKNPSEGDNNTDTEV